MLLRIHSGAVQGFTGLILGTAAVLLLCACGSASRPETSVGRTEPAQQSTVVVTRTVTGSTTTPTDQLAGLVSTTKSGIVRITANGCGTQEVGTGFLVGRYLVATVEHVVDGATSISLTQGRKAATGVVVGDDPARDVALIRSNKPLSGHIFHLASRTPPLGSSVAAIGFPLGLPLTVTQGDVSGLRRTIPIDRVERRSLIQTDAAVNPGNSGGPLLSVDNGTVVGLIDLGTNQANGIAFAVSAQVAGPLIQAWEAAPQTTPAQSCAAPPQAVTNPQQTSTPRPAGGVPGPVRVLDNYWNDISHGDYSSAYGYLAPGAINLTEAQFVSNEQQAGITNVTFSGQLVSSTGEAATVDIASLQTIDTQYGCRNWTGSYEMVDQHSSWVIERSNITPQACA